MRVFERSQCQSSCSFPQETSLVWEEDKARSLNTCQGGEAQRIQPRRRDGGGSKNHTSIYMKLAAVVHADRRHKKQTHISCLYGSTYRRHLRHAVQAVFETGLLQLIFSDVLLGTTGHYIWQTVLALTEWSGTTHCAMQ